MDTLFGSGHPELPQRLKRLRQLSGLDLKGLSERAGHQVGLSTAAISRIETGRLSPSPEQIAGLARALGCSPDFLTAELKLGPTSRPWLRAYADASKREADARTAGASIAVEYTRRLGLRVLPDQIPFMAGDLDPDNDADIEDVAGELRRLADIAEGAVVANAIRAAERLGCLVLPLVSELGKHLGMSVRSDDVPVICVANADEVPGDRQRFTVAHELGHLVLHGHVAPPRDAEEAARMERQANRFAIAFLGPGDALIESLEEAGGRVTLSSLATVKAEWGIAIKALIGRYKTLQVIDEDHARSLYKQMSARKMTRVEPVVVRRESAQWFDRSLRRKARTDDLASAARSLATSAGGNAAHLLEFADWSVTTPTEVVSLDDHRIRRNGMSRSSYAN